MLPEARERQGTRVTFFGVGTLLFDDGETQLLTDGFFTRPGRLTVLFGKIGSDQEIVKRALARAQVTRLAAVVVAHSHYDHALDASEVAKQTGALIIGSESTANIARGAGLPEAAMRVVHGGETFQFGRFSVELIRSLHSPHAHFPGEIGSPLQQPARSSAYREGETFSILIRHGEESWLVHASAGFIDGALAGRHADVVFLGIATLGKQDAAYQEHYWREVVSEVGARRVVPVHWDDFTQSLDGPLTPLPRGIDDFDGAMQFLLERGRKDGIDIRLAPAWATFRP
jgi:L-ascorbate metabolism protein UlaG (beta-lactamase superfamily)